MSELKIHTWNYQEVEYDGRPVKVAGTDVTVGGERVENVLDVTIEGKPDGVWTAILRVAIDPVHLFSPKERG